MSEEITQLFSNNFLHENIKNSWMKSLTENELVKRAK